MEQLHIVCDTEENAEACAEHFSDYPGVRLRVEANVLTVLGNLDEEELYELDARIREWMAEPWE
jgi:hypothetical protein